MPYKIHKTAGGKFKLYREAVDGKSARPMSKHPQSKATATDQLRAIKMHENESASETPELMGDVSGEARDETGKWTTGGNKAGQGSAKPSSSQSPNLPKVSSKLPQHKRDEVKMGREASERGMAQAGLPVPKFKEPAGLKTASPVANGPVTPERKANGSLDFTKAFGLKNNDLAESGRGGKQSMVGSPSPTQSTSR